MTIYDTKGNRIDYVHTFTTNGGDEGGNWYDKYEEGNDEETSEEEVLDIFSEYNELDVDSKRGLRLIINSKKTIPKHLIQDDDDKIQYANGLHQFCTYDDYQDPALAERSHIHVQLGTRIR